MIGDMVSTLVELTIFLLISVTDKKIIIVWEIYQEAQPMLTNRATRSEVSQGHQT